MLKKITYILSAVLLGVTIIFMSSNSAYAYNVGGADINYVSSSAMYGTVVNMSSSMGVYNQSGLNVCCQSSVSSSAFSGSVCELVTILSFSATNNYGTLKITANGTGSITMPQYARIYDYTNGRNGNILTTARIEGNFAYFNYTGYIPSVIKVSMYVNVPANNSVLTYILRDISFTPISESQQEEQKAEEQGNASVSEGMDAIEDKSEGFINALGGLTNSMSYTGTQCAWEFPQVKLPAIPGVMDEMILIKKQPIDFAVWVNAIPSDILLVVQSLCTAGLIIYCFKELYSTIAYVLTLRKDDNS